MIFNIKLFIIILLYFDIIYQFGIVIYIFFFLINIYLTTYFMFEFIFMKILFLYFNLTIISTFIDHLIIILLHMIVKIMIYLTMSFNTLHQ